jgi:hypothetical protein
MVSGNTVVDATDVGIILFAGQPYGNAVRPDQASIASGNTVLNAGNSAFAMFAFQDNIGDDRGGYVFTGGFDGNVAIGSLQFGADLLFAAGTYMHDFIPRKSGQQLGTGGYFHNNRTVGFPVRVEIGMLVDGMAGVDVSGNSISTVRSYNWNYVPWNAALRTMGGVAACSNTADTSAANQNKVMVSAWSSLRAGSTQASFIGSGTFAATSPYVGCAANPSPPGVRGCVAPVPIKTQSVCASPYQPSPQ